MITKAVLLVVLVIAATWTATALPAVAAREQQSSGVPAFIQADRCYRFSFAIAGPPNWKVQALEDHGWIRAQVDAGPASADRETVWVNAGQIITAREARCSN